MRYLVRKVGNQIIYGWFDDWHYGKPMWVSGPFSKETPK